MIRCYDLWSGVRNCVSCRRGINQTGKCAFYITLHAVAVKGLMRLSFRLVC